MVTARNDEALAAIDEAVWSAIGAGYDREAVIAEVRYALDVAEETVATP